MNYSLPTRTLLSMRSQLLVEDERRHHKVFADLADTLQTEVTAYPRRSPVPRLGHWGFERAQILELTEAFLAQERNDAVQLQDLEAELDPLKDTTMWPLLVRVMQADTSKHVAILEFVKEQAGDKRESSQADWSGIERAGVSGS